MWFLPQRRKPKASTSSPDEHINVERETLSTETFRAADASMAAIKDDAVNMTRARKNLIDSTSMGTYHLITRGVRRERLLDRGERKMRLCRGLANCLRPFEPL